jgi:hypothetical protein
MTIAVEQVNAGTGTNKTSGTNNLTVTVAEAIAAGKYAVLAVVSNNLLTTDGSSTDISITDSRGNTWSRDVEETRSGGAAAGGVIVGLFRTLVTTGLQVGDTITVTTSAEVIAKGAGLFSVTVGAGNTLDFINRNVEFVTATAYSVTLDLGSSAATLWVGVNGYEGPTGNFNAPDVDYTQLFGGLLGTSGGAAASNVSAGAGYLISTAQTETYDRTSVASSDRAAILAGYREVSSGVSVTLDLASETDTAFDVVVGNDVTTSLDIATETGSAFELSVTVDSNDVTVNLDLATETDSAFNFSVGNDVTVTLDLAVETNSAFDLEADTPAASVTVVTAVGDDWYVNGTIINEGSQYVEGQMLSARMVQALFDVEDDGGPSDPTDYQYPGEVSTWTAPRDPDRNVAEFIAAIPTYRSYGLNMVTVCMQGGAVGRASGNWIIGGNGISAWNPDGTIKAAWKTRLIALMEACDDEGMILNLQCFYHNRDDVLTNETAVTNALHTLIDIILDPAENGSRHFRNVLFEVVNEAGTTQAHTMLNIGSMGTTIPDLKSYVSTNHSGKTLLFSCSRPGGSSPDNAIIGVFDYISLHTNNDTPTDVINSINATLAKGNYNGCPIQVTEDNTPFGEAEPTSFPNMVAAVETCGRGWGFYDQPDYIELTQPGANYIDGFQSPPVNWGVNTPRKQLYFDAVDSYTSGDITIVLDLATENDTANDLTVENPQSLTLDIATETDQANDLTVENPQSLTLDLATETETAFGLVIDNPQSIALDLATETETALDLSIDNPQLVVLDLATETETAQSLSVEVQQPEVITLSLATETDSAFNLDLGSEISVTLDLATETDSALDLTSQVDNPTTVELTLATETDSALELTVENPNSVTLDLATEVDTAYDFTIVNPVSVTLDLATETDTAHDLTAEDQGATVVNLDQATETDQGFEVSVSIDGGPVNASLDEAIETSTAFDLAIDIEDPVVVTLDLAVETESASDLLIDQDNTVVVNLDLAQEVESAFELTVGIDELVILDLALEMNTAFDVDISQDSPVEVELDLAEELNSALDLLASWDQDLTLDLAMETDEAFGLFLMIGDLGSPVDMPGFTIDFSNQLQVVLDDDGSTQ